MLSQFKQKNSEQHDTFTRFSWEFVSNFTNSQMDLFLTLLLRFLLGVDSRWRKSGRTSSGVYMKWSRE